MSRDRACYALLRWRVSDRITFYSFNIVSGAGDGSSVGGSCCHVASSSFFVSNEFQELRNDTFT